MDKQDYDKAIKECWDKFCKSYPHLSKSLVAQKAFKIIFDHIQYTAMTPNR